MTTSFSKMAPFSRNLAPKNRPQAAPRLLNDCDRFRRKAEIFRLAHRSDQRVGRDLQEGNARRHDEQGDQENGVDVDVGGRDGHEATGHDGAEADHDGVGVAELGQEGRRRQGHDAVGNKEGEAGQVGLDGRQGEDGLHGLQKRVEQVGNQRPDEEETRYIDHGERKAAGFSRC